MGFNEFIVPGRAAETDANSGTVSAKKVLEKQTAQAMLQALAQLCDVRSFATEIFTNLQQEAAAATARINDVRNRIEDLQKKVPHVEDMCHQNSPLCFYNSYTDTALSRKDTPKNGLFIRSKAPPAVNRRRHEAKDPPDLNVLNRYEKFVDLQKRTTLNCLDLYTNPMFFFDEWRKRELEAQKERRKKRKKKKKKKKKHNEPKKVAAVEKWYTDEFGKKRKKVIEVKQAAEDRQLGRGMDKSTKAVDYGRQQDYSQMGTKQQRSATLYEPGTRPATAPASPRANAPPMASSGAHQGSIMTAPAPRNQAPRSAPPAFNTPPVMNNNTPPPGPAPAQMTRGPPQFTPPAQPTPGRPGPAPVSAPPAQPAQPAAPAKPQLPDYLKKFAKMVKIGLPAASVKHKMAQSKIDESMYDLWLDPNGPQGATAGASTGPPASPPTGPPRRPNPMANLGAAIRGGTTLKKAEPLAPKPQSARGGLLDAIKKKSQSSLKSASSRQLKEIDRTKVKVSARDNMLSNLRRGVALKKTKITVKPAKKEPENDSTIFALMARRNLIEDSDEEDSESGSWDDESS